MLTVVNHSYKIWPAGYAGNSSPIPDLTPRSRPWYAPWSGAPPDGTPSPPSASKLYFFIYLNIQTRDPNMSYWSLKRFGQANWQRGTSLQYGPYPAGLSSASHPSPAYQARAFQDGERHPRNTLPETSLQHSDGSHDLFTFGQTSFGNFRPIRKRKRKRTIFTTEQVEALEKIFSKKPYISRDDRQFIVNQLNLSDKSVKIWFQNRRLKDKRQENEANDDALEETGGIDTDSLDYVESEIRKNTDEFGYVTLDDRMMGDLVSIIDNCLTKSNDIEVSSSPDTVESGSSIIYEPISPASSECSEKQTNKFDWEAVEPTQSLQTLLDIQSLIQV
ncbi:hypothetical protein K1T71_006616 [Dendrolimus kikuchii]|uniref:Uncharacterized protein n=1 Tax=Dendrolimus kikuchii TaxID=765133 RepID=A0ACC1D1D4_9NEOP|nr:hypothetical protein K1T71_006616 [Dendrolimus kikuchii]